MTKITIDEDLNFDKTHFKNIEEFIDYLRSLHLIYELQPTNLANEDVVSYSNQTESMVDDDFELPQWQKDVIDKRLEDIENGKTNFQDFKSALREIEKDL
jgi:hypothetical protein